MTQIGAGLINQLILPKITMSRYDNPESEKFLRPLKMNPDEAQENYLNSPEITCSPSPCIYDGCENNPKYLSSSPGNRTPSPDWRFRRRSLSPFNRSASPSPRRGSITPSGYEQYQKSLLEVPFSTDYADASSDDLSSEWDSDVPDATLVSKSKVIITQEYR